MGKLPGLTRTVDDLSRKFTAWPLARIQVSYSDAKPVRDLESRFRETDFGPRMGIDNAR